MRKPLDYRSDADARADAHRRLAWRWVVTGLAQLVAIGVLGGALVVHWLRHR